jgi:hypothetical protein
MLPRSVNSAREERISNRRGQTLALPSRDGERERSRRSISPPRAGPLCKLGCSAAQNHRAFNLLGAISQPLKYAFKTVRLFDFRITRQPRPQPSIRKSRMPFGACGPAVCIPRLLSAVNHRTIDLPRQILKANCKPPEGCKALRLQIRRPARSLYEIKRTAWLSNHAIFHFVFDPVQWIRIAEDAYR